MIDSDSHFDVEVGSDKGFGLLFSGVFFLVGVGVWFFAGNIWWWCLVVSALLLFTALVRPSIFRIANKLWFRFGLLLGHIVGSLMMIVLFYLVIFPTGIFIRLAGKDLLKERIDPSSDTYWVKRSEPVGSMKNQF